MALAVGAVCLAGCYTAHAAIELYAEVFAAEGKLDLLEGFASFFGPDFYQLPRNIDTIEIVEDAWEVPESLELGNDTVVPIRGGDKINWRVRHAA